MAEGLHHDWGILDLNLGVALALEKQPFVLETDVEDQGFS